MVPGFSSGNAHVDFQVVDGAFNDGSDFVKRVPFIRITLNAREHTQVKVFVCVCSSATSSSAAGVTAFAEPFAFLIVHFGASPFYAVRASLLFCNTMVFHGEGRVIGICRIAIFVVACFFEKAFISWIIRNNSF